MNICTRAILLLLNMVCIRANAQSIMQIGKVATPWELEKTEGKTEGYTRRVEGKVLKEFKVICTTDFPLEIVKKIVFDPATWKSWYSKAFYGWKVLDTLPDGYLLYCEGHTPLLIAERDFVLQVTGAMAGEKYIVKIKARPEAWPLQPNRLRVDEMEMLWILTPAKSGQTEVVFMGFSAPGGALPERFANSIMIRMPMQTVGGLGQYLHKH